MRLPKNLLSRKSFAEFPPRTAEIDWNPPFPVTCEAEMTPRMAAAAEQPLCRPFAGEAQRAFPAS